MVENGDPRAVRARPGRSTRQTGGACAIGVTGPPGVGKSTLIGALISRARAEGRTVGVISVDPSSTFSRGAVLGDRIRLSDHFLDPGVFIRSMATRGHLGGIAEATLQAALILAASGKDLLFLETVGIGQSEIEIAQVADTVLLVLMPGSGDSVQASKAGIIEIPDVISVNKSDHPQAKSMLTEVRGVLALGPKREWAPPIVLTEALRGDGVDELWEALASHRRHLESGGRLEERRRRSLAAEVFALASGGRSSTSSKRLPTIRSCAGSWPRWKSASSIPSPRFGRSSSACFASSVMEARPAPADIGEARRLLAGRARVTPVYRSETLGRNCGRPVLLKAETLQRTGSFKVRGAVVKLASLDDSERRAGVVAASAGNHGQAVAWAAREAGLPVTVFMPSDAPLAKVDATRSYGAEVAVRRRKHRRGPRRRPGSCGRDGRDARPSLRRPARDRRTGNARPRARRAARGARDRGRADRRGRARVRDRARSRRAAAQGADRRRPGGACAPLAGGTELGATIAEGIAVKEPGSLTRPILEERLADLVTVSDEEIAQAIVLLLERTKLVVEGAGAAPVAALLAGRTGAAAPSA